MIYAVLPTEGGRPGGRLTGGVHVIRVGAQGRPGYPVADPDGRWRSGLEDVGCGDRKNALAGVRHFLSGADRIDQRVDVFGEVGRFP